MRSFLLIAVLMLLSSSVPCASAGWFGDNSAGGTTSKDVKAGVASLQKDASQAWQAGKKTGTEKAAQAKEVIKDGSEKAQKKGQKVAKEAASIAKSKKQQAEEEGKGLMARIFGK